MDFSERLKAVIKKTGLKREEFAERVGKSRTQIFKYLGGEQSPTADFFLGVKQSFPWVNIEWLITGVGEMEARTAGVNQVANGEGHIQIGGSVNGQVVGGGSKVRVETGGQEQETDRIMRILADYVSPKLLEEIRQRLNRPD